MAAAMAGDRQGSGRAAMVAGLLGAARPAEVDPLLGRHPEGVGPLVGGDQHRGRHVDVHDRRHQLGVGRGHHPVVRGDRADLVGRPGHGEPGVLGLGGGHLAHRGQQAADLLATVLDGLPEVPPAGGVQQREGQVGLEDPVLPLQAVDGDGIGLGLVRAGTTRPARAGAAGWRAPPRRRPGRGPAAPWPWPRRPRTPAAPAPIRRGPSRRSAPVSAPNRSASRAQGSSYSQDWLKTTWRLCRPLQGVGAPGIVGRRPGQRLPHVEGLGRGLLAPGAAGHPDDARCARVDGHRQRRRRAWPGSLMARSAMMFFCTSVEPPPMVL